MNNYGRDGAESDSVINDMKVSYDQGPTDQTCSALCGQSNTDCGLSIINDHHVLETGRQDKLY